MNYRQECIDTVRYNRWERERQREQKKEDAKCLAACVIVALAAVFMIWFVHP